jgi:leucyl aminopeptidase
MLPGFSTAAGADADLPLWLVTESDLPRWLGEQGHAVSSWVRAHGFQAERHRVLPLPGGAGAIGGAVLGLGPLASPQDLKPWHAAGLAERLPPLRFRIATPLTGQAATHLALGWLLGGYRFSAYRAAPAPGRAGLAAPPEADHAYVRAAAEATAFARDLINTPANDLGPSELAQAAVDLARDCGATCRVVEGQDLARDFPLIHAVGKASPREPRLIDLRWGRSGAPRVTLVGKGICFDTGGLDVKPSAGMLLMKKDMGGAACALALAQMLMRLDAPLQLRVLVPAAENAVDGASYRPGDILRSKKGLTVEIGNTDAEGRLVLADALAEADGEKPDLLIDLATLTGAARTALGPDLPAAYSGDEALLAELRRHGDDEADPIWPMPLWSAYDEDLASRVADVANVAPHAFAGSIIGALFLKRFVSATPAWLHLDIYAWNPKDRPGRPVGAEVQCVRSLYRLIRARYG